MKKFEIITLGCRVNQYESSAVEEMFLSAGYEKGTPADVCCVNTCTVTAESDRKSRQMIRRIKKQNPGAVVIVSGCMAQISPEKVALMPEVDVVIGTNNKKMMVLAAERALLNKEKQIYVKDVLKEKEFEDTPIQSFSERQRAFVKIQEGCENFCSYCIIPYARGKVRSRTSESIIKEVKALTENGFCEIVLTGINTASFGKDTGERLIDLIKEIHNIEKVQRIRIGSVDPNLFSEEFTKEIAKLEKACNHFHLSLQSGSDSVLLRMRRKYTADEYAKAVERIRENIKEVSITTDIITGFPGETEEEFIETLEFVKKVNLNGIHVFPYSEREGTAAAKMKPSVPVPIRTERAAILIAEAEKLRHKFLLEFIGQKKEVLAEQRTRDGLFEGYTSNYIKVLFESEEDVSGKIVTVTVKGAGKDELFADIG